MSYTPLPQMIAPILSGELRFLSAIRRVSIISKEQSKAILTNIFLEFNFDINITMKKTTNLWP